MGGKEGKRDVDVRDTRTGCLPHAPSPPAPPRAFPPLPASALTPPTTLARTPKPNDTGNTGGGSSAGRAGPHGGKSAAELAGGRSGRGFPVGGASVGIGQCAGSASEGPRNSGPPGARKLPPLPCVFPVRRRRDNRRASSRRILQFALAQRLSLHRKRLPRGETRTGREPGSRPARGTMRLGCGAFAAGCIMVEVLGVAVFLRGFFPAPVRSSSGTEHQAEHPAPEPSAGTDPCPASRSLGPILSEERPSCPSSRASSQAPHPRTPLLTAPPPFLCPSDRSVAGAARTAPRAPLPRRL